MKLEELREQLTKMGINPSNHIDRPDWGMIDRIEKITDDEWEVFYSERGGKFDLKSFRTEKEACEELFNRLVAKKADDERARAKWQADWIKKDTERDRASESTGLEDSKDKVLEEIEIVAGEEELDFLRELDWIDKNINLSITVYKKDIKTCLENLRGILNDKKRWTEKVRDAALEKIKNDGVWNEDFNNGMAAEELYNMLKFYRLEVYNEKITFCFNDGDDMLYGGHDLCVEIENNDIISVDII